MTNETPARKPGPNTVAGEQPRSDLGRWLPADERRQLTERQIAFAVAYAGNGGNGSKAALSAGYSPGSESEAVCRLLRLPWVLRAVSIERKRLMERAGLLGLHVLIGVLEDPNEDKKLRVKAAEIALKSDRADRDSEKDSSGAGKRLNEMSISELEAMIRRLDQAAELAQQPILEHAPDDNEQPAAELSGQAIDTAGENPA